MKRIRASLFILMLLFGTACSAVTRTYLAEDLFTRTLDSRKEYFTNEDRINLSKINAAKYEGPANMAKRKVLIADMVALSDKKCTWHKATVMANANIWNISAGTASILFAGAASVVDHSGTASELAAAAAATTGIRSLANQEIYSDALVTTILRAIDVQREKRYSVISAGMVSDTYTVAEAVRDVQFYHDSCSLMAGLVEVTSALDNRKKSRAEVRRDIADLSDAIQEAETLFGAQESTAKTEYLKPLLDRMVQAQLELSDASE